MTTVTKWSSRGIQFSYVWDLFNMIIRGLRGHEVYAGIFLENKFGGGGGGGIRVFQKLRGGRT